MTRDIPGWFRWICAPTGVTTFAGFCLFLVPILLVGFMGAYFHGVISDNHSMRDNPMVKMINDANLFTEHLKNNASGHALLDRYQWLHHFEMLARANCNMIRLNLQRLRYVGYAMAVYNTFLMHVLLHGVLPVSLVSSIPIFASILSNQVDQSMTILLGLLEFGQIFLSIVIFGAFLLSNEKKNSHRRREDYEE